MFPAFGTVAITNETALRFAVLAHRVTGQHSADLERMVSALEGLVDRMRVYEAAIENLHDRLGWLEETQPPRPPATGMH